MLRFLLPIAVLAALVATSLPAVAAAAEPAVAPPASARVAAACKQRSAAAEATKDQVTRVPRGDVALSGCVSDDSGIEAVVVRWASNDGDAHGRICTDPAVLDGQWRCSWDAGRLPLGAYDLELVAVDAAGNRGSSTRRYELIEPPAVPPTTTPEAGSGAVPLPAPSPEAEPQAEPDTAPEVTPTTPEAQPEPADPPEPVFSAIQQLVIDRVVVCERGGSDLRPTDDADVTTEREQAELVVACLRPALELAGANPIELRETAPEPYAIVATVVSTDARIDLDAALPNYVAGIPVSVVAPDPDPDAVAEPAVPDALFPGG